MYNIDDLIDYAQTDCVFDIYDVFNGEVVAKGLTQEQGRKWHEEHEYELVSFEPIQRIDLNEKTGVAFGIQFNVNKVFAKEDNYEK